MKKYLVALLLVLLAGGAAAGVWTWRHGQNPLDKARNLIAVGNLADAQLVLRTAVLNDPSNAEAHFRLGSVQLQLGDPIAAEKEFKAARKNGYDAQAIAPHLVQAYLTQGKFQDVLAEFPVEALPPAQAVPLLISRGLAELGLKHFDAAQAAITQAVQLDPHAVGAPLAAARVAIAQGNPAAAEQKVDQALQIDGRSIEALQQKAALLEARGEHAQAAATYDTAIALAPKAILLRIGRANALIAANENAKAVQDVDFVLKADPKNRFAIFQQAILLIRAKEWAKADMDLQQLSLVLAQLPRGEYFLAMVKANVNQLEQATDAATRYVARTPNDPDGYKLLASIDLAAHRPDQAVEALKKAVLAGRADTGTLRLLSQSYAQTGQIDLAVQTLERAAALAPDDPAIPNQLAAERLQAGDPGNAEKDLQHSLELAPTATTSAATAATLVIAALQAGDIAQAVSALDTLRQQKAAPVVIDSLTGLVKLAQLDLDGARAAFEKALETNPDAMPARLSLARVLMLQGKPEEAEKLLEDSLAKQPANAAALNSLVPILLGQQKADRAVAAVEAGHAAAPTNLALTISLADLYGRTGNPRKALDLLDQAPKDQAEAPAALAARARAQQALGLQKDAQESYRQIVAKQPADPEARRLLAASLLAANDPAAAKAAIRDGLATLPGNPLLLETLVAITAKADGIEPALALAAELEKDPANLPAARVLAGDLDMSARRFDAASAAFTTELKAAPSAVLALRAASAQKAAGAPDKAASLLRDWLTHHPEDLSVTEALASFDLESGRLDEAEAGFHKAVAARPNDAAALNNLAWIYQQRRDARARATAQRAYLISPQPQIADTLGWILVGSGDPSPGLLLLRQAAAELRNTPSVQYHLAVALKDAGQHSEALAVMKALPAGDFAEKPDADRLLRDLSQP